MGLKKIVNSATNIQNDVRKKLDMLPYGISFIDANKAVFHEQSVGGFWYIFDTPTLTLSWNELCERRTEREQHRLPKCPIETLALKKMAYYRKQNPEAIKQGDAIPKGIFPITP
jgi:hypothetical protein